VLMHSLSDDFHGNCGRLDVSIVRVCFSGIAPVNRPEHQNLSINRLSQLVYTTYLP
jgi:hypothetical protein